MKFFESQTLDEKQVAALTADLSVGNEKITETAGFIPLEVKFKQFEQNGLIAQFMQSDFDSNDIRDIYLNPDFQITPEDDFEDIQDKIAARNEYKKSIQEKKSKVGSFVETANPPSDSAAADKKKPDEKKPDEKKPETDE